MPTTRILSKGISSVGIAFAQDFEHLDDLAGVVELRLGVDPQQHAGEFALVVFRILLEHGGEIFERLGILAIVEVALAEGEALADVHLIGIGRFFAGGEHGEFRGGTHGHERRDCRSRG